MRSCGIYDKIVQSASSLFQGYGYGSVSIRDIVSAINVPKGNFYNHFASKEALASSIVERQLNELYSLLPKPDDEALVGNLWLHFRTLADRFPQGTTYPVRLLGTLAAESLVLPPLLRTQLAEGLSGWSNQLATLLATARDHGSLTAVVDVRLLADFLGFSFLFKGCPDGIFLYSEGTP
jgi:TetR/AcrR family transcriptional regulator, transcriptional repressor for nem operon